MRMLRSPPRPIRSSSSPPSPERLSRWVSRKSSPASCTIAGSSSSATASPASRKIIPRRSADPSRPSSPKWRVVRAGRRRSAGSLGGRGTPLSYGRGGGGEGSLRCRRSLVRRAGVRPEGRAPYWAATFSRGEKGGAAGRSQSALESNHLARPDAFVRGEDDAQRVDHILEVLAEIDLATDRLEEQALLALTQFLMAWFVPGRFDLVGMREGAVGFEPRMVKTQCVGAGVAVMVS